MGAAEVISVQNVPDEEWIDQSIDDSTAPEFSTKPGSNILAKVVNSNVTDKEAMFDRDLFVCVATNVPNTAAATKGDCTKLLAFANA